MGLEGCEVQTGGRSGSRPLTFAQPATAIGNEAGLMISERLGDVTEEVGHGSLSSWFDVSSAHRATRSAPLCSGGSPLVDRRD